MSGYGKLCTLVMCLCQLLASNIYINLDLRSKIYGDVAILSVSIFMHRGEFALPYSPPDLLHGLLGNRLWRLYSNLKLL